MRIFLTRFFCVVPLAMLSGCVHFAAKPDLNALYKSQKWSELHGALQSTTGNDFYRGVVGVIFNQSSEITERLLESVIRTEPATERAYEAHEWLSHLYLYAGQYARFVSTMESRWRTFPSRPSEAQERAQIAGFRGLPDQLVESVRPSSLVHSEKSIFIPLKIDGSSATYFFDTGAWMSAMSESEARRLGLRVLDVRGTTGTMNQSVAFRTAIATQIVVGDIRVRDVSFLVFPDNLEPWSLLPTGRRGILGIPILRAFGTLRWERSGALQIGNESKQFNPNHANLIFDNDHLAVRMNFQGKAVWGSMDTGAETTDFYRTLATQFPSVLKIGKKGSTEVRGVGNAATYDSLTLPEVVFELDGQPATLRSVPVLMNRTQRSYVGNVGMDLLGQGSAFTVDFGAMTLRIEPNQ